MFLPRSLIGAESSPDPWVVTEGPTDLVAAIHAGFTGVGRPSSGSRAGAEIVVRLARRLRPPAIVVTVDAREDADATIAPARRLALHCPDVRLFEMVGDAKDLREMVLAGATGEGLGSAVRCRGGGRPHPRAGGGLLMSENKSASADLVLEADRRRRAAGRDRLRGRSTGHASARRPR